MMEKEAYSELARNLETIFAILYVSSNESHVGNNTATRFYIMNIIYHATPIYQTYKQHGYIVK